MSRRNALGPPRTSQQARSLPAFDVTISSCQDSCNRQCSTSMNGEAEAWVTGIASNEVRIVRAGELKASDRVVVTDDWP